MTSKDGSNARNTFPDPLEHQGTSEGKILLGSLCPKILTRRKVTSFVLLANVNVN